MEPVTTLALTAISYLIPYFTKFGEAVASEAGKTMAGAPAEIYRLLKDRFAKGSGADKALESVKDKPTNSEAQEQLTTAISSLAATDARFAADLQALLAKAQSAGSATFNTSVHGTATKLPTSIMLPGT